MNKCKDITIKIGIIICMLFPILMIYATPISFVCVADVFIIGVIPFLFFLMCKDGFDLTPVRQFIIQYGFMILINYFLVFSLSQINDLFGVTGSMGRYLLYFGGMFLLSDLDDKYIKSAGRVLRCVAVASTVYLFIQILILEGFGWYLPGTIPFLKTVNPQSFADQIFFMLTPGSNGRPMSFFQEPSHYGFYIVIALYYELIYEKGKHFLLAIFLSVGVLFSVSSTGIILTVFLWVKYVINGLPAGRARRKNVKLVFALFICAVMLAVPILNTNRMQILLRRVGRSDVYTGRFDGFGVFAEKYSLVTMLFGHGMDEGYYTFMPGIPMTYYYFGLIGLILLFLFCFVLYLKVDNKSKDMLLLFLIANIGSNMFFGHFLIPCWLFLRSKKRVEKISGY